MDKVLDQSEIDSMFASMRAETQAAEPTAEDAPSAAGAQAQERFNFAGSGQITREQLEAISSVNGQFAQNLTSSLGAWLRSQFDVALVSAEQMSWASFTSLLSEPVYLHSVALDPLEAIGALQLDLAIAPPIVDLLLGGTGRPGLLREPTEIEDSILRSIIDILVRDLNTAWRPAGLAFALNRRERDAQIVNLMPASEKVLCVSFEVRMADVQGFLHLCLPSVVLNALYRRFSDQRSRSPRRSVESRARLQRILSDTTFDSSLQFPTMRLNARLLADLAPGKVLPLPLARQASAELRIAGLPIFDAMPVRLGERRGAQLNSQAAVGPGELA